jgi:hypothetical protein
MGGAAYSGPWSAPVLGPYAERRLRELLPCAEVTVVVAREFGARRQRSDLAMQRAIGEPIPIHRGPTANRAQRAPRPRIERSRRLTQAI